MASWACVRSQAWRLWDSLGDLFQHQLPDTLLGLGEKLFISLLALLAPEFIFVWVLRQWLRARSLADECRKAAMEAAEKGGRELRRVAHKRAELEYLTYMGVDARTDRQNRRYKKLSRWAEAPEEEKTRIVAHEVGYGNSSAVCSDPSSQARSKHDLGSMNHDPRILHPHGRLPPV